MLNWVPTGPAPEILAWWLGAGGGRRWGGKSGLGKPGASPTRECGARGREPRARLRELVSNATDAVHSIQSRKDGSGVGWV